MKPAGIDTQQLRVETELTSCFPCDGEGQRYITRIQSGKYYRVSDIDDVAASPRVSFPRSRWAGAGGEGKRSSGCVYDTGMTVHRQRPPKQTGTAPHNKGSCGAASGRQLATRIYTLIMLPATGSRGDGVPPSLAPAPQSAGRARARVSNLR